MAFQMQVFPPSEKKLCGTMSESEHFPALPETHNYYNRYSSEFVQEAKKQRSQIVFKGCAGIHQFLTAPFRETV